MDSNDSDIVILQDFTGKPKTQDLTCQSHEKIKAGSEDSCGEDCIDEVPDFDDAELEVLDCWEDEEEINDDKLSEHKLIATTSSSLKDENANKQSILEAATPEKSSDTSSSDKAVLSEKTVHPKKNEGSKSCSKSSHASSKRKRSPVSHSSSSKAAESKKSSNKPIEKRDSNHSSSEKSTKKSHYDRRPSDLPSDPTETKVDKFLKEIAQHHPKIIGLQDNFNNKASESRSSDFSKHSSRGPLPGIDPSDLPPGIDMRQSCEDTSTSHLLLSSKTKDSKRLQSVQTFSGGSPSKDSSQKSRHGRSGDVVVGTSSKSLGIGLIHSEMPKGSEGDKDEERRSPHSKYHTSHSKRSSRSPPHKVRRISPAKSFSISPSPSPRSHQPSRSPLLSNPYTPSSLLPTPRIPPLMDYGYPSTTASPMYGDRHSYQSPLMERDRYYRSRSPARDSSLSQELSRSSSRERLQWSRSRSRSRERHSTQSRSRSRHQYSSIDDDQHRRYRRSASRSRSGAQRSRSRSRSWSPHRYTRKRSPLRDERGKRLHMPRSRSGSPWKSHAEISSNEWHNSYQDRNLSLPSKADIQLEHVMEKFIQTNMAATGLIPPPAPEVRGWVEQNLKAQESKLMQNLPVLIEPESNVMQGGMPLPPPPPDISELMCGEEIKEASTLRAMTPEVSLSSLLESAVTGCPDQMIIERCQDAIMKLHDVSIKPGRFAVIPSIQVPQSEISSTFRPWQSVLNRSSASKIQLSFSKPSEKPVLWEPHNSKFNQLNQTKKVTSSHKETAPAAPPSMSSTVDTYTFNYASDRAVLLDRIFTLTKELQNMKQALNCHSKQRRHIAVQTLPVMLCETCGKNLSSPLPNQVQVETSASSSTSGFWASASSHNPRKGLFSKTSTKPVFVPKQLPISKASQVPALKSAMKQVSAAKPAAKQLPAPKPVPVPQPVPVPKQLPGPHPMPAQQPNPVPTSANSQPVSLPPAASEIVQDINSAIVNSKTSSHEDSSSNQSVTSYSSQKPSSHLTASSSSPNCNPSNVPRKAGINLPAIGSTVQPSNGVPQASSTCPLPEKTIPSLLSLAPVPAVKQVAIPNPIPMSKGGFDLSQYLMLGDEYMFDLIAHLRSSDVQVKYNAKFCSTGQTVDMVHKNVLGGKQPTRMVIMLGLYNGNYNEKLLVRYKHLIGFLRKRCSHLVLIEPPPIPKWGVMKHAWGTFTDLKASFSPFQAENVSVVFIRERLMLNSTTPNPAFYVNNQRLSREGLCIVTDELRKAVADARNRLGT